MAFRRSTILQDIMEIQPYESIEYLTSQRYLKEKTLSVSMKFLSMPQLSRIGTRNFWWWGSRHRVRSCTTFWGEPIYLRKYHFWRTQVVRISFPTRRSSPHLRFTARVPGTYECHPPAIKNCNNSSKSGIATIAPPCCLRSTLIIIKD